MKDGRDGNEPKETPAQSFDEFREQFRKKDPIYLKTKSTTNRTG